MVGLDDDALTWVPSPVVGIIFLYPFSQMEMRKKKLGASRGNTKSGPKVWFMKQTIGNACGAVALMHTVMNCMEAISSDSKFLNKFKVDATDASSAERGKLFGGALRELHDEVSVRGQTEAPRPDADLNFHFVSLVPVDGVLYELDGNNDGPIAIGPIGESDGAFLKAAAEHVKNAYVAPFPNSHFSMIALCPKAPETKQE